MVYFCIIEELVTKTALVKFCDLKNNVFCYTEVEFTKDRPYFIELELPCFIQIFVMESTTLRFICLNMVLLRHNYKYLLVL